MTDQTRGVDVIAVRAPTWPVELLEGCLGSDDPVASLREIFADPQRRDALALASMDVLRALDADDESPRLVQTLMRYLLRMTLRPTPFGLFATTATAEAADVTCLEVTPVADVVTSQRLAVDVVRDLLDEIRAEPEVRASRVWRTNPTAHLVAESVHYVETRRGTAGLSHHLVAAHDDGALSQTLALATAGITLAGLAEAVASTLGVQRAEADSYVEDLAEAQLLVDDLQIAVAGLPAEEQVIAALPADLTTDLRTACAALTTSSPWAERLTQVGSALDLPVSSNLAVVEAVRAPGQMTIGPAVVDELRRGVELLARLSGRQAPPDIESFAAAFTERWGSRWVPLLAALDHESGIDFDRSVDKTPLLDGIEMGHPSVPTVPFGSRDAGLVRLLVEALRDRRLEVDLDDLLIAQLQPRQPSVPMTAYALTCRIAAADAAAMDSGELEIHLRNVNGPAGSRMLGRFTHGDDALCSAVRRHHAREAKCYPDAIVAEVVHLPEGRVGNILSHPVLRDHEIVLLSGSALPASQQIRPAELLVGVVAGEVQLRRASDHKRVIPRMTTAHAYTYGNIGIYRFLCQLQNADGSQAMSWSWGALSGAPFLPRVRAGRLVVSLATWHVSAREVADLKGPDPLSRVAALRARTGMPRWVTVGTGESELPLDLDNALCAAALVDVLDHGHTEIVEIWPPLDRLPARGVEGRYVTELVVAFSSRETPAPSAPVRIILGTVPNHLPGGDWLFLKVYCATTAADAILELLSPTLDGRAWFFIRYADPDHHLRVRVAAGHDLLPAIHSLLAGRADVLKVQLDTYEPELDRYGGALALPIVERIFAADSVACLEVLARLSDGDTGADERWRMTLASMDSLWSDSGLPRALQDKAIQATSRAYEQEFALGGDRQKPIGARLRMDRARLNRLMSRDPDDDLAPGYHLLEERSEVIRPLFAELRTLDEAGRTSTPLAGTISSIVHMSVNRWLRSQQRSQEAVLYQMLTRLRRSQAARS